MRAAVTHWRDGTLVDAFRVTDVEFRKNLDGSETCLVNFPKTITALSGDKVKLTYYTSEK
jgi:hypothetical protein